MAFNKPLKALALLDGTLTHGLRHFVPNFSPCVSPLSGKLYAYMNDFFDFIKVRIRISK
jgi:hypothetical protein